MYLYKIYLKGGAVMEVEAEDLTTTVLSATTELRAFRFTEFGEKSLQHLNVMEVAGITWEKISDTREEK